MAEPVSPRNPLLSALRSAGLGLLGAGCVALATPAAAQGLDGSNNLLDSAMELFGLKEEQAKPEIDYRERAPLVVPPRVPDALPPPQSSAAEANPNWPKDPDIARRKREAETSKTPIVRDDPGKPLLPSELNKGRRKTLGTASAAPTEPVGAGSQRDVLMPDQLGFTKWFGGGNSGSDKMTFNGEPERDNLIQPPAGYQTPAPNAPYGVVEEKKEPFKLPTLFDRQ
ncbi:hypothetical protein ABLE93_11190 [Xanthobacter sp. KR7-65]|uniref:hypothetical protein n=1 Tax=Xanthobacter sp. KR7-65 TaxID=3156612 RepID=UPI0032B5F147